jgi:hypothetical protein
MIPDAPLPKPSRRLHIKRWLLLVGVLAMAWSGWGVYDQRQAEKEVQALGWVWVSADPIKTIRKDWKAVFRKDTWFDLNRGVTVPSAAEFDSHRSLIRRLRPNSLLVADASGWKDLSSLRELTQLKGLALWSSTDLVNVDELTRLPALQLLVLNGCKGVVNVDALAGLPALKELILKGCTGLVNVDALAGLPALQTLGLNGCTGLVNVDALAGLPRLKNLYLNRCTGLTKESISALKARLPNTLIESN